MSQWEQVGGTHYAELAIQPWDVIRACGDPDEPELVAFCRWNAVKYLMRYRKKGGVEDLKKARHYIDQMIVELEPKGASASEL